ncbi:MAG: AI-2E family transporter [Bacteroidetes bacterium]|nr:MAG: AI-2E family transporter [Bacteroidota bacterium]
MESKNSISTVLKITTLLLLLAWCVFIIKPFILVVLWAIILAVALFPVYKWLVKKMGASKKKLTTLLFTLVVASLFLVPAYFITTSAVETTKEIGDQIRSDSFQIPEPKESVKEWPVIGEKLYTNWLAASKDLKKYSIAHKEVILEQGAKVLSGVKGFIGAFITFIISFLIAVVFMYNSDKGYNTTLAFLNKLIGKDSEEIVHMSRDTIRSVVKGILLVALIQAGLAFIGFRLIDLPAAEVFAFLVLIAAIIQLPALLIIIPAIILVFSYADTTPAIIFTVYIILVGLSDNLLKPILLGKGLKTPMIIILIGTIGGLLLHGIIGLFLGPVVLAVMHRLYLYWVTTPAEKV